LLEQRVQSSPNLGVKLRSTWRSRWSTRVTRYWVRIYGPSWSPRTVTSSATCWTISASRSHPVGSSLRQKRPLDSRTNSGTPSSSPTPQQVDTIVQYTAAIGRALGVRGLFNIQNVVFEGTVYVIEVNPRGSRTFPFLSKVSGVQMVDLAVRVGLGQRLCEQRV